MPEASAVFAREKERPFMVAVDVFGPLGQTMHDTGMA